MTEKQVIDILDQKLESGTDRQDKEEKEDIEDDFSKPKRLFMLKPGSEPMLIEENEESPKSTINKKAFNMSISVDDLEAPPLTQMKKTEEEEKTCNEWSEKKKSKKEKLQKVEMIEKQPKLKTVDKPEKKLEVKPEAI